MKRNTLVILIAALLSLATTARAEELGEQWQEIVLGTNTFAGGYSWHYFYYDATEDGTLVLTGVAQPGIAYLDSLRETMADDTNSSYVNGVKVSSTVVTTGTRYYFATSGVFSVDTTFTAELITEDTPLTLSSVSPAEYDTISVTGTGLITITFNLGVTFDDATLSVNDAEESVSSNSSSKQVLSFDVKSVIYDWIQAGTAELGDTVTLTITGLCAASYSDKLYGDDGILSLKFICPDYPMMIEEESTPETFLSYWVEGDEDGIMTLTFSENIYSGTNETYQPGARLTFGGSDDSDYYQEALDVTIDGNKLILDFTGKLRTLDAMGATSLYVLDSSGNPTDELRTMNLKVYNVCDEDGNTAYSSVSGNLGSYSYSFDYEQITVDVSWEFTPEDGTTLEGTEWIELAMVGYDVISFEGVEIDYTYRDEQYTDTLTFDDLVIETDALVADFTYVMIPVKDEMQTSVDIAVSLVNTTYTDGISRTPISAQYDTFGFTLLSPKTTIWHEYLEPGDTIKVQIGNVTDRTDYFLFTMTNTTRDSVIINQAEMIYDSEADIWYYPIAETYSLMESEKYELYFAIHEDTTDGTPLASASVTITGAADEDLSTGITSVNADGDTPTTTGVYTLDGRRVSSEATSLPAGLYIVNGKKVVVK